MSGHAIGRIRLLPFVVAAFFVGAGVPAQVHAQTVGPDEAVTPQGAVTQNLALTQAQKSAIYNAVVGQRVRNTATHAIRPAVGAPVPPSAELLDLPIQALLDQDSLDDSRGTVLKYAIVEGEVVVIDPIQMQVVDVIHGGATSGRIP
jgi:hypothetical protein